MEILARSVKILPEEIGIFAYLKMSEISLPKSHLTHASESEFPSQALTSLLKILLRSKDKASDFF
jgi:hypothetical protein